MAEMSDPHDVIDRLQLSPARCAGPERVALLGKIEALRRWLAGREAEVLALVHAERDDVNAGARDLTQLLQQRAAVGFGEAKRRELRAVWLQRLPAALDALLRGTAGVEQVDALCALADRLDPDELPALFVAEAALVAELADMTPPAAKKRLIGFEHDLADDDGRRKLDKQRRANALRLPKYADGAVGIHGQLDPILGAELRAAIDAKVTQMWRRQHKNTDEAPPASVISNDRRRADALIELVRDAHSSTPGRAPAGAQLLVLIDHQTLLGQLATDSMCRLGDGTPIPASEARRLACNADIIPVVLGSPSQPLDVGRSTRLATPAQRAALRAIHDTCSVKGCDVAFEFCEIHHITWWRHGGQSDLLNLTPLCAKHHHLVHDTTWALRIGADRVTRLVSTREVTSRPTAKDSTPTATATPTTPSTSPSNSTPAEPFARRARIRNPARPAATDLDTGHDRPGDRHRRRAPPD